jgi:hypothetical protein
MEAFKYGIGQPGRALANNLSVGESRPMLRNAMTRIPRGLQQQLFLEQYFKQENPEAYAKIYVNAWPKLRYSRRLPRTPPPMKQTLATVSENSRRRKQKTRKVRR